MLSCKQAQELFYDHLDKELSPEEATLVQGHLDGCSDCCGNLKTAEEFIACVRSKLGKDRLPDGLADRISSALGKLDL